MIRHTAFIKNRYTFVDSYDCLRIENQTCFWNSNSCAEYWRDLWHVLALHLFTHEFFCMEMEVWLNCKDPIDYVWQSLWLQFNYSKKNTCKTNIFPCMVTFAGTYPSRLRTNLLLLNINLQLSIGHLKIFRGKIQCVSYFYFSFLDTTFQFSTL